MQQERPVGVRVCDPKPLAERRFGLFRVSRGGGTRTPDLRFWRPRASRLATRFSRCAGPYAGPALKLSRCPRLICVDAGGRRHYIHRVAQERLGGCYLGSLLMTEARSFWWALASLPLMIVGALSPWAQAFGVRVDGSQDELVLLLAIAAAFMLVFLAASNRR
jgi:hypothetical protein